MKKLIVFDLDKTLVSIDTADEWFRYAIAIDIVKPKDEMIKQQLSYEKLYSQAKIDMKEYVKFSLKPFIGMEITSFNSYILEFVNEVVIDKVYSRGKALISEYKRKNSEVVLISATIKNLVEPVGLYLGFPRENILAINILEENNRIKGETKDTLTFKEGKVERLLEWANNRNITTNNITFYSDSVNDLPLLEYAKTAIATNPSKDLYQIAKLRGWQIIEFEH